jgi:hypothetical protein
MSIMIAIVISALIGAVLTLRLTESHDALAVSNGSNGPLFGVSASNSSALSQTTGQFGHMPIVRVFYPGLPSSNAWTTGAPGLNRSAVIVSFKATAQTILSGADDATLRHFFDSAPTGHPIYYSYYPEPERYIASGLFTVSEYKAAWTHIVTLADAASNPDLQSTLILTSYDLSPQSGRNWKDYLAGGNVISTLGWDAYPAGTVEDKNPQATPPADFMGAAVAASKSAGMPFGFAEFALATQNGRPAWLTDVGNYLASSGALFGTYFDSAGFAGMQLTDGSSISAWRNVIARSGTNVPLAGNTPPPTASSGSAGLAISGLAAAPATLADNGTGHVRLSFDLSQAADVTICVLNSHGSVVRQLALPGLSAGQHARRYAGRDNAGHLLSAGKYPILIVASNSRGSATAEAVLTVTGQ